MNIKQKIFATEMNNFKKGLKNNSPERENKTPKL